MNTPRRSRFGDPRPRCALRASTVAAVLAAAMALLLAPAGASAQFSVCEQYPSLPQCADEPPAVGDPGRGDTGGSEPGSAQPGSEGGGAPEAGPAIGGGGALATPDLGGGSPSEIEGKPELPFTGYPLTPFVLLLAVLLALGLLLRALTALRDRLGLRRADDPAAAPSFHP